MKQYLQDRLLDCVEWFDFRPDAPLWPVLLAPGALGLGYWLGGPVALYLFGALGLALAVIASVLFVIWLGVNVFASAAADFLQKETNLTRLGVQPWRMSR